MTESPLGRCIRPILHSGGCKPVGPQTKACQLAASLRADAADILQIWRETQRLDFDALVNALELRFGEKCVKDYSRLQPEVTAAESVRNALKNWRRTSRGFLTWRFLTVRLEVREVRRCNTSSTGCVIRKSRKLSEWRISRT
ncbi:hypothetical protein TNCV_3544011 [Trichonephila clavipes]|nr:hypothetical protein TNCV_3544011 [Trichonephila clavipes]